MSLPPLQPVNHEANHQEDDWVSSPFGDDHPVLPTIAVPVTPQGAEEPVEAAPARNRNGNRNETTGSGPNTVEARAVPVAVIDASNDIELGALGGVSKLSPISSEEGVTSPTATATAVEATAMPSPTLATSIARSPFTSQNSFAELMLQMNQLQESTIGDSTRRDITRARTLVSLDNTCSILLTCLIVCGVFTGNILFLFMLADKIQNGSSLSWNVIFLPIRIDMVLLSLMNVFKVLRFIFFWEETAEEIAQSAPARNGDSSLDNLMDAGFIAAMKNACEIITSCVFIFMIPSYLEHGNVGLHDLFLPIWIGALSGVFCGLAYKVSKWSSDSVQYLIGASFRKVADLVQVYLIYLKLTGANFSWAVALIPIWIGYGAIGAFGFCFFCSIFAMVLSGGDNEHIRHLKTLKIGPCIGLFLALIAAGFLVLPLVFIILLENYLNAEDEGRESDYTMMEVLTPLVIINAAVLLGFVIMLLGAIAHLTKLFKLIC